MAISGTRAPPESLSSLFLLSWAEDGAGHAYPSRTCAAAPLLSSFHGGGEGPSLCQRLVPVNRMKRQKDRTLEDELPRLVGIQYATRDQWRNNSRKNEGMEPKQKEYPAVDVYW